MGKGRGKYKVVDVEPKIKSSIAESNISKGLSDFRLCTKCGEPMDIKNARIELCTVCRKALAMESAPEPEDIGEQMCWCDHVEVKKHHCKSRKELARRQSDSGKKPQMQQCLVCGTHPKCMPYTCDPDADYLDSTACSKCGVEFRRKSHNKKLCPECTKINEKESSKRSYEKKFGVKKKCQKNTNADAAAPTVSSIPPSEVSQTISSAPVSTPCPTSSNIELSNQYTVESTSSSS